MSNYKPKNKIVVLHAYSSSNSGDGLLVEKTIKNIDNVTTGLNEKIIVCIDKNSFMYLERKYVSVRVLSIPEFIIGSFFMKYRNSYFVAVGGGYIRSGNFKEGLKCCIAHGSQLIILLFFNNHKKIYLSQSIGPLNGFFGFLLTYLLKLNKPVIMARDNKTVSELCSLGLDNIYRAPDLVTNEIINSQVNLRTICKPPRKIYLVVRDLSSKDYSDDYIYKVRKLYELIDDVEVVVQSKSRGNDDVSFAYNTFGLTGLRTLKEALEKEPGVVISVRLHGSLESILSGSPSIHLAYERKGLAAYQDLNIREYAHHCSNLEPSRIVDQANYLLDNYKEFFKLKVECNGNVTKLLKMVLNDYE